MITNLEKINSWKWRRAKAGMSLSDMSKITGRSIPQLSNYETGKTRPSVETVDKVEAALIENGAPFNLEG